MSWSWSTRRDHEGTFWDVLEETPFGFYIYDNDNDSPSSAHIGKAVIRAAQYRNPVLTTVYKLTYGSLP